MAETVPYHTKSNLTWRKYLDQENVYQELTRNPDYNLEENKSLAETLETLKKSESKDSSDYLVQFHLGILYLYGKSRNEDVINIPEAERHLKLAGRYSEAEIQSVPKAKTLCAEAYLQASIACYVQGHPKMTSDRDVSTAFLREAYALAKKSQLIDPRFNEPLYHSAKYLACLGRKEESLQYISQLLHQSYSYIEKISLDIDFNVIRNDIQELVDKLDREYRNNSTKAIKKTGKFVKDHISVIRQKDPRLAAWMEGALDKAKELYAEGGYSNYEKSMEICEEVTGKIEDTVVLKPETTALKQAIPPWEEFKEKEAGKQEQKEIKPEQEETEEYCCGNCGANVSAEDTVCPKCGKTFEPVGDLEKSAGEGAQGWFLKIVKKPWGKLAIGLVIAIFIAVIWIQKHRIPHVETGDSVTVQYVETLKDGTVVNQTMPGTALLVTIGSEGDQATKMVGKAMQGMKLNEEKVITINAGDAYGFRNETLKMNIPRTNLPKNFTPQRGIVINLQDGMGNAKPVTIIDVTDKDILVDLNHPLAGKDLVFNVKVVGIKKK